MLPEETHLRENRARLLGGKLQARPQVGVFAFEFNDPLLGEKVSGPALRGFITAQRRLGLNGALAERRELLAEGMDEVCQLRQRV